MAVFLEKRRMDIKGIADKYLDFAVIADSLSL
jgi:hypothetical protein